MLYEEAEIERERQEEGRKKLQEELEILKNTNNYPVNFMKKTEKKEIMPAIVR